MAEQKYGRLTVTSESFRKFPRPTSKEQKAFVTAVCECGTVKDYMVQALKRGMTKSCGCMKLERAVAMGHGNRTHGMIHHPLYLVLKGMKQRCYCPKYKGYKYWGGRGITICDEWRKNFRTFYDWAIVNGWKEGLEIDRENNDGNYEPSNCRFITPQDNVRNRGWNKLTMDDAVKIRGLAASHTQKELGFMFNTCKSNIAHVIHNKTWV